MSNDAREPGKATPSEDEGQQSFMKEFEQLVTSFAQAVEAGKSEAAQGAAMEALVLAAEEAERHPTPSLVLKQEAAECESKRDWAGAEAGYRKVLALEEATGNQGLIAKAQMDLSRLLRLIGRLEEASQVAASATASARKPGIFPVLVMALENEVACALARKEPQAALVSAAEMVQVIEPGKVYDSMRARALIHHGRCLVAIDDVAGAESRLVTSWELLQGPGITRNLPGPTFALANWWEVKSQVLELQGDIEAAREANAQSLVYRCQNESPYGIVLLIRALEKSAEFSQRAGDLAQAERAFAEANSLREDLQLPACS